MGLLDLRKYIQENGKISLRDICLHFQKTPPELEPMLQIWMNKGHLIKEDITLTNCGGCTSCDQSLNIFYTWNLLG